MRIGIAGLGLVGSALARRAHRQGWAVAATDVAPDAIARAGALSVEAVPDVAALAAGRDAVWICVLDDRQLLAVVDALVIAPARPQACVIATTCSPQAADRCAAALVAAGIDAIESPFSGSSAQIADGDALALVGADPAVAVRHAAMLDALAPCRRHVGAPGTAARAKLASNLVLGLNRAALAEGLALAQALGLDGAAFLALLRDSPAYSRAVDLVGPRMLADDGRTVSRIGQHRKDLELILAAAAEASMHLPLAGAHAALLDAAIARGLGARDNAALLDVLRAPSPEP